MAGTCEWITQNESYRTWLNGDGSSDDNTRLLWISGGPGKGKTMMSIFLTEELERHIKRMDGAELVFFFCSAQDEKRNTPVAVLRGLVHQIIDKRPQLVKHALPHFKTLEQTQQTLGSLETLWIIFIELVADAELGTMFCVLDGLDECEESTLRVLLPRIVSLLTGEVSSSTQGTFKLAIVSRDIPGLQGCTRVRLDPDNNKKVVSDIKLFVSARVEELSRIEGFNEDFRESVQTALLERAEGTFLWVGFAMHELSQKQTCTGILKALEGLPPGLPAIYTRMLLRIPADQKATSCAILRWVTMAQRPLKLLELAAAVSIEAPHPLIRLDQAVRDAISCCKPLLEIQNEKVRLIHQSARDYMLQKDPDADVPPGPFRITSEEAHSEIAQTCLDCIIKSGFKYGRLNLGGKFPLQESALLAYATFHWPGHAQSCSTLDAKLLRSLEHFFEITYLVRRHWWAAYRKKSCRYLSEVLPLLHMLCYLGFEPLIQRTLAWDRWRPRFLKRIDSRNSDGKTALHLVAHEGKEAIVRLLVDKGANVEARNKRGETALHIAAGKGNQVVLRLLVDRGADIDAKYNDETTALHLAANEGEEAMVRLLVDKGANVEARNKRGETALHVASQGGKKAVVWLLVDSGADLESKSNNGRTALHHAVCGLHETLVQLLLDKGADVEERDEAGRTVLLYAAEIGTEATVKLLVNRGADINAKSNDGWTALHWAVLRRHEAATSLLIDKGADVTARSNNGWTVRHSAVGRGNKALVQLLRAHLAS